MSHVTVLVSHPHQYVHCISPSLSTLHLSSLTLVLLINMHLLRAPKHLPLLRFGTTARLDRTRQGIFSILPLLALIDFEPGRKGIEIV